MIFDVHYLNLTTLSAIYERWAGVPLLAPLCRPEFSRYRHNGEWRKSKIRTAARTANAGIFHPDLEYYCFICITGLLIRKLSISHFFLCFRRLKILKLQKPCAVRRKLCGWAGGAPQESAAQVGIAGGRKY